jgi:hypothetical protein
VPPRVVTEGEVLKAAEAAQRGRREARAEAQSLAEAEAAARALLAGKVDKKNDLHPPPDGPLGWAGGKALNGLRVRVHSRALVASSVCSA